MNDSELLLIDLSGIAHQIWHVSGNEPDPSHVSTAIIARVRSLASEHRHAAICCDGGRSFRADIDPTYKANRDTENRAPLRHQMDVACETLKRDGFPVWRVKGFEADDLIATATAQATAIEGATVLIASSDKDLLQLVNERVSVKSLIDGNVRGPADVFDKFGVRPEQMGDLLALDGDKADNIKGADRIGKVIAARLLAEHGTLEKLYDAMSHGVVAGVTPAMRTSLLEFKGRWPVVRQLIALRTDVPDGNGFQFSEIAAERVAAAMEVESMGELHYASDNRGFDEALESVGASTANKPAPQTDRELDASESTAALRNVLGGEINKQKEAMLTGQAAVNAVEQASEQAHSLYEKGKNDPAFSGRIAEVQRGLAARDAQAYAPVDFSQQLEPRNMTEAKQLAQLMFDSRLFSAYGTPQAVLATVLAGRELGIPAMASLRAMHIIDGKPQLSADTLAALVIRSGKAKYFRCTERTDERCTFVTQRIPAEDYPEQSLTFTIEDAKRAWKKDQKAWDNSGYGKVPAAMLVARAKAALARLEYPDVVGNLYGFEELE